MGPATDSTEPFPVPRPVITETIPATVPRRPMKGAVDPASASRVSPEWRWRRSILSCFPRAVLTISSYSGFANSLPLESRTTLQEIPASAVLA